MNQSSRDILLAKQRARDRARLVLLLLAIPVVGVLALGGFAIIGGKALVIVPPEVATEAQISKTGGAGWVIDTTVYHLMGEVEVEVTAAGYFPERVSISSATPGAYVEVQMRERPATLELVAEPAFEDTRWLIDGREVSSGPMYAGELAPGSYELRVDNPYFELYSEAIVLQRAESYVRTIVLQPIRGTAELRSVPTNAQVMVDGDLAGTSNLNLDLPGGVYRIEVTKANHATVRDQIEISRARPTARRTYQLSASPAYVSVAVSPPGGTLLLDGTPIQPGQRLSVSPGIRHVVAYDLPGFNSRTAELDLKPGETREINLALNSNVGSVAVESEPSATVQVNGRAVGMTPMALELPAVEHSISIRKPGYITHEQKVLPSDGRELKISVQLETEKDYRLRTAPRQYQNSAGMQMLLFRPDTYQKGARRGEPGRRANETLHTVHLKREFYVAQHEVSAAQFQSGGGQGGQGNANLPATNMSWYQAAQYCNQLSRQENLNPVYAFQQGRFVGADMSADGYRLLTESEWEWLARAAGRPGQTVYEWGDDPIVPVRAGNFADEKAKQAVAPEPYIPRYDDGYAALAPIGSFLRGPSGLYDLSGNVSEWVHDAYALSPNAEDEPVDPAGPRRGDGHVFKGSSWRTGAPEQIRPAYRESAAGGRDDLGFRVARYLYNKPQETSTN